MIYSLLGSVSSFKNYWWADREGGGGGVPHTTSILSFILQKCVEHDIHDLSLTWKLLSGKTTYLFEQISHEILCGTVTCYNIYWNTPNHTQYNFSTQNPPLNSDRVPTRFPSSKLCVIKHFKKTQNLTL